MDLPDSEHSANSYSSHKPVKEPSSTSAVGMIELLSNVEFINIARESLAFLYSATTDVYLSAYFVLFVLLLPHPSVRQVLLF